MLIIYARGPLIFGMLKIRLQRIGKKKDPKFRIVLTDSKNAPKSGSFLEILGSYDPTNKKVVLKKERIEYWRSKGSQISQTALQLFKKK